MNLVQQAHPRPRGGLWIAPAGLVAVLALAHCSGGGNGSANVGTPCVPADESDPLLGTLFGGFRVTEESIEVGTPECGGGVCLVNHFQGRVTCPLGQEAVSEGSVRKSCNGPGDATCGPGSSCVQVDNFNHGFVCHVTGNCQSAEVDPSHNIDKNGNPKDCCLPGTDTPVAASVCGQCGSKSNRSAEQAVYCSCRCGVADGEPDDPSFPFCTCPVGFACEQIRPNLGVGDPKLTGKYCIKEGSRYTGDPFSCGELLPHSHFDNTCSGTAPLN